MGGISQACDQQVIMFLEKRYYLIGNQHAYGG